MVPNLTLNNGSTVPIIGLGTWKSKPGEVENAVKEAINLGYRHIDTAAAYGNEGEVGAGIRDKIQDGTVKREDLYVVTKLWNNSHRPEDVEPALDVSLKKLGLDYIDLYLIHWPMAVQAGEALFPRDKDGNLIYADVDYKDTWKAMEKLVATGKVRSVGVSNFNEDQLTDLLKTCSIRPAMNQIEVNPYFVNDALVKLCQKEGIQVTAYSPLGSGDRPWSNPGEPVLLADPNLQAVADRLGKSTAQVLLRWVLQRNIIVIPKSVTPSRIKENFNVFDFELSEADMALIASFDRGVPLVVPMIDVDGKRRYRDVKAPHFPFKHLEQRFEDMQSA